MKEIDELLLLVMPDAPAAPEPLVVRHLRDAATRFCERSRSWRCVETFSTNGNAEIVPVPPDGVLHEITACSIDGRPLDPISLDDLAVERPNWRTDDVGSGGSRWFVAPEHGSVQIVPRSAGTVTVEYIAKPAATAQTVPDFLVDLYGRTIADGAAAGVLLTPAFANPQLAAAFSLKFEQRLDALAGGRGQHRAPRRTRAQFF